jgi:hypothetical protein
MSCRRDCPRVKVNESGSHTNKDAAWQTRRYRHTWRQHLMSDPEGVPLADYIRVLRDQLETAQQEGAGRGVKFGVGAVELEFEVTMTREAGGRGGLKLWVVEAGADGKRSGGRTQRVRMTLTPTDDAGRPLSVTDRLPEPPR